MKLVIDIPEEVYKRIQSLSNADYFEHDICGNSMRRIANGKPLPKGHGRLIDADAELEGLRKMMGGCSWQWTAEEIEEVEEGEAE